MAVILFDELYVCVDCLFVAEYGFIEDSTYDHIEHIKSQLNSVDGHWVSDFDSETGEGVFIFSLSRCDGCGSHLGGDRYRMAVLS